jgi:hypothetical protein
VDFTDRNAEKAAPVLHALGAVKSAARAAITAVESTVTPPVIQVVAPASSVIVAPNAFAKALTGPLTSALKK